mmetsp:Transcript_18729/g.15630  ORF Transcript_18729/g.15630 Transcript_18729/m.15630 type:complete len:121 (-) Transcript_18729:43-405(-)
MSLYDTNHSDATAMKVIVAMNEAAARWRDIIMVKMTDGREDKDIEAEINENSSRFVMLSDEVCLVLLISMLASIPSQVPSLLANSSPYARKAGTINSDRGSPRWLWYFSANSIGVSRSFV